MVESTANASVTKIFKGGKLPSISVTGEEEQNLKPIEPFLKVKVLDNFVVSQVGNGFISQPNPLKTAKVSKQQQVVCSMVSPTDPLISVD